MFKIGEKVVYKGRGITNSKIVIPPNENEVVTIAGLGEICSGEYFWDLKEYPFAIDGELQSFSSDTLHKLDHTFAEELTSRIEEEIKWNYKEIRTSAASVRYRFHWI